MQHLQLVSVSGIKEEVMVDRADRRGMLSVTTAIKRGMLKLTVGQREAVPRVRDREVGRARRRKQRPRQALMLTLMEYGWQMPNQMFSSGWMA